MNATPPALSRPPDAAPSADSAAVERLVACLCAAWCRTCDAYRDTLLSVRDELLRRHPAEGLRFLWIDIEDEADRIGDLDIVDFPTVLLARDGRTLFLGPLTPHPGTLERLVENVLFDPASPASADLADDALALPARLAGHPPL